MPTNQPILDAWINASNPLARPSEYQLQRWARAGAWRAARQAGKRLVSRLFR